MRHVCVAAGWVIAAVIVWLSLTPVPPQIDIEQGDKIGHLLAYGTLMYWFCLLYARTAVRLMYGALWIGMGISLEFVQGQLGYRTYDVYDMVANTIGVLLGWALAQAFRITLPGLEKGKQ